MPKNIFAIILIVPLICLMCWTGTLFARRQSGQEIKVAIQGYDPRDLLSGHYIQYQIDWNKTDCGQFSDGICPENEFCIDARWGRQCRFYVPEKYAAELDKLFRQFRFGEIETTFEVIYSYTKGKTPIAKQLLIDGRDWRETVIK